LAQVAKRTVTNKPDPEQKALRAPEGMRALPEVAAGFSRHPRCRNSLNAQAAA